VCVGVQMDGQLVEGKVSSTVFGLGGVGCLGYNGVNDITFLFIGFDMVYRYFSGPAGGLGCEQGYWMWRMCACLYGLVFWGC